MMDQWVHLCQRYQLGKAHDIADITLETALELLAAKATKAPVKKAAAKKAPVKKKTAQKKTTEKKAAAKQKAG